MVDIGSQALLMLHCFEDNKSQCLHSMFGGMIDSEHSAIKHEKIPHFPIPF